MHARLTGADALLERAATARLLSIGLSPPDGATLEELRGLAEALDPRDGGTIGELRRAVAETDVDGLACAYQDLFGGRVACSPYEAGYEPDPFRGTRQIADAAGFYRAFGAAPDGPAAERPDHVACELEFLAFLLARRAAAVEAGDEQGQEVLADVEDAFVRSHLSRFMGPLCEAVAAAAPAPAFAALAAVGAGFIEAELAARAIAPPALRRPGPCAVDGDEVTCGVAGGCSLTDVIGGSSTAAPEARAQPSR